jgi:hypothetical protein
LPKKNKKQIEENSKKLMNDIRMQGDTTYYVKSVDGRDSILLTTKKGLPEELLHISEEMMRQRMINLKKRQDE